MKSRAKAGSPFRRNANAMMKKSFDKHYKLFYNKYTYIKRSVKMEFSFSLNIRASKEDVWAYYENIEKWYDWEEDLKILH